MRDIKKAIFRYESLSMCIIVLVCMYMDVVIYLGGWGCLNLPDPPTKPTYKESLLAEGEGTQLSEERACKFL